MQTNSQTDTHRQIRHRCTHAITWHTASSHSHPIHFVLLCRGDDEVSADTLAYGQHDAVSKEGLDRMAKDLDAQ